MIKFSKDGSAIASNFLTAQEAATYLDVSISTLYKFVHERKVTFYKPSGKLLRFSITDLDDFITSKKVPSRFEKQLLIKTTKTTV